MRREQASRRDFPGGPPHVGWPGPHVIREWGGEVPPAWKRPWQPEVLFDRSVVKTGRRDGSPLVEGAESAEQAAGSTDKEPFDKVFWDVVAGPSPCWLPGDLPS